MLSACILTARLRYMPGLSCICSVQAVLSERSVYQVSPVGLAKISFVVLCYDDAINTSVDDD